MSNSTLKIIRTISKDMKLNHWNAFTGPPTNDGGGGQGRRSCRGRGAGAPPTQILLKIVRLMQIFKTFYDFQQTVFKLGYLPFQIFQPCCGIIYTNRLRVEINLLLQSTSVFEHNYPT